MTGNLCEIIPGLLLGSINDVDDMVREGADVMVALAFMDGAIWKSGWRGEIIYCPITDMDVLPDDVLRHLVETINDRLDQQKKVGIFCAGGHGRTGYVAACVLSSRGIRDPIGYIRSRYSAKAVETEKQAEGIYRFIEMNEEARRRVNEYASDGICDRYDDPKQGL